MASLVQLLLLLSSDLDGEIVAAARAIDKVLKRNGSDWHALADRLVVPESAPQPRHGPVTDWDDLDAWEVAEALLKGGYEHVSERERDFLESMSCWNGQATYKQDLWLRAIAARLRWHP